MFVKYLLCLFVYCLSFVEMKPFKSMSQDMEIIMKCNSTSPVDKKTLNTALIHRHMDDSTGKNFKCFLYCLYYNYGWMNSNGIFEYINMKSTLSETNLDDFTIEYLIFTCTLSVNEDKCEKAAEFTKCFWAESQNDRIIKRQHTTTEAS